MIIRSGILSEGLGVADQAPTAILLVEDEAIVARDLQESLTDMGYDVFAIADSAEDAIECAAVKAPDIVLMDIRIKGQEDGIRAAEILKDTVDSAIIYLTAHADDATIQRAKKTEPYGYLLKPVKTAELRSMIEMVVYKRERDEARKAAARLDSRIRGLIDLNLQLASERDPRVLLEKVCDSARRMFGAKYVVLAVNEKSTSSIFSCTSGIEFGASGRPVPRLDFGPLGHVYAQNSPWRADKIRVEVFPAGYPAARAYLAVPISSLTRTYGWICLADGPGADGFTPEDEKVLGILAGQVGRIYENGSLYLDLQMHAAQLQVEIDERERAVASLGRSEERFRQLAENIRDVFFILSPDFSEMTYQSPAFEQIWGRPPDPTNPMDWTTSIHADDYERMLHQLASHAQKPVHDEFEFRIVQPNGSIRWILARHFPLYDDTGRPYRIVGVATDITERKLAEEKIRHLNRVYAVLSGINGLIVRAQNKAELFTGSCRLAVEQGDFQLAWIGWLTQGEQEITPIAWAGSDERWSKDILSLTIGADSLQAIRRGEPWVCNDLGAASPSVQYQQVLIEHGLRSVVTLPLSIQEKTVGCLVLATDERESFDAPEMRLLIELAGDISFALDYLEKAEKLNYLAYYDSLTGLANRTLFLERVAQQVNAAKRNEDRFAVVVRDPERFDTINQTFGRTQGDMVLKEIADRLVRTVGDQNFVARIGSDQFASVLPFSGAADVAARALEDQYQAWVGAPFRVGRHEVTLTARAGIAIYPDDATDAESLLGNAEAALKRSSSPGDRTVFFTQQIGDRIAERLSMETQLRHALSNEEFVLHYQPKVDLESRQIVGLEALIRWQSPELGLVPPAKFIPLMEETGMIIEVGAWVMLRACTDRCFLLERELPAPRVAVNVSSVQLRQPDFLNVVRATLDRATRSAVIMGASEAGVDVEVTESLFVESAEANVGKLSALRALGVEIAIDDFGTGYSSLGYLAKMPLDSLKIDRAFTANMLDDPSVMTLVSTIITLARSLNLKVIAEGVESEDQARILRLLRCDQMQGYLVSKALPFDEIMAMLARSKAARKNTRRE
jgi:diguanylate cyclase (GGDEF)-like protein/PAS domain S-box-containing protein